MFKKTTIGTIFIALFGFNGCNTGVNNPILPKKSITIQNPKSGESFVYGDNMAINWTSENVDRVDIQLRRLADYNAKLLSYDIPAVPGTVQFIVTERPRMDSTYVVYVTEHGSTLEGTSATSDIFIIRSSDT